MDTIGGLPLICGQQSSGAFAVDNTGKNMDQGLWNTASTFRGNGDESQLL